MAYDLNDFSESIARTEGFKREEIAECVAAWGGSPDGRCSWEGGFLLKLKNGRWAYLTGWCDTTGWGCKDGATTTIFETRPALADLVGGHDGNDEKGDSWAWDENPADLNRYIHGEVPGFLD